MTKPLLLIGLVHARRQLPRSATLNPVSNLSTERLRRVLVAGRKAKKLPAVSGGSLDELLLLGSRPPQGRLQLFDAHHWVVGRRREQSGGSDHRGSRDQIQIPPLQWPGEVYNSIDRRLDARAGDRGDGASHGRTDECHAVATVSTQPLHCQVRLCHLIIGEASTAASRVAVSAEIQQE